MILNGIPINPESFISVALRKVFEGADALNCNSDVRAILVNETIKKNIHRKRTKINS